MKLIVNTLKSWILKYFDGTREEVDGKWWYDKYLNAVNELTSAGIATNDNMKIINARVLNSID